MCSGEQRHVGGHPGPLADRLAGRAVRSGHSSPPWTAVYDMTYDGVYDRDENEREQESWAEAQGDVPHVSEEMREQWRGEAHLEHWPESLAGPEYWLYLSDLEDGDDDSTGKQ